MYAYKSKKFPNSLLPRGMQVLMEKMLSFTVTTQRWKSQEVMVNYPSIMGFISLSLQFFLFSLPEHMLLSCFDPFSLKYCK